MKGFADKSLQQFDNINACESVIAQWNYANRDRLFTD
jgi:hypothetical protein